jgi:hypothetical protein
MSVSANTARVLHQALGDEAADEMIHRFNEIEAGRTDHREMIQLLFTRHDERVARQLAEFRGDMQKSIADFKTEVRADIARLDNKIENRFAELMRWSLVYWLGAVGAIAALARILS